MDTTNRHTPALSIREIRKVLDNFDRRIATARQVTSTHGSTREPTLPDKPITGSKPAIMRKRNTHLIQPLHPGANSLAHEINAIVPFALADSTLAGYDAAVRRFLDFCDTRNVPAHLRFPTDEVVLSAYAASFACRLAGSSVDSAFAALKTWHALNNAPWNGGPRLTYMQKAAARLAPASSHRAARPGVSLEHMDALADGLDLENSPKDAAVFAAAALAFWCIIRIGELLGTSRRIHQPALFPSRSSISGPLADDKPLYLHLPRTKTSQITGESVRILRQRGSSDPMRALSILFERNKNVGPGDHLFAFRATPDSPIRCLTKEDFLARCNEIWLSKGMERLSGHNFRIGGTNTFIDAGVPSDIVKSMGRWKSGAYYKYWRKPEDKASAYAECIPIPERHADRSRAGQGRLATPAVAA